MFSDLGLGGDESHAHGFGPLGEVVQHPLAIALLEGILSPVGVLLSFGQHGVDQAGHLWAAAVTALGLSMRAHMHPTKSVS